MQAPPLLAPAMAAYPPTILLDQAVPKDVTGETRKRKRHAFEEWEQHRALVSRLYLTHPLPTIVRIVENKTGFHAGLRQWRNKIKEWELNKKYKKNTENQQERKNDLENDTTSPDNGIGIGSSRPANFGITTQEYASPSATFSQGPWYPLSFEEVVSGPEETELRWAETLTGVQLADDGDFEPTARNLRYETHLEPVGIFQLHSGSSSVRGPLFENKPAKAIAISLENLPNELRAFDTAYEECMNRIEGQRKDYEELAKQVLSWVTCARRPLTALELQHALAVKIGEPELDPVDLSPVKDLISACAGLVIVDERSRKIRFVHHTAQEYFERTQSEWFPDAQRFIAITCVTYLLFDVFESGRCQTQLEFEMRLQQNPLYGYVAANWGHHVREASIETEQLVQDLLQSKKKLSSSKEALAASRHLDSLDWYRFGGATGAHIAAYFELREALRVLLEDGSNPNAKDKNGRTPLSWAIKSGRESAVELLLVAGADPDCKDRDGRTPLSWAAEYGQETVVMLLLAAGADPEAEDYDGRTPLSWAASGNLCKATLELLLAAGADLESKDSHGRTPLSWAAPKDECGATVKLLLVAGADPDSKENDGRTPSLITASKYGCEATVKLLLAAGADPESKDNEGRTPTSWAAGSQLVNLLRGK